MTGLALHRTIVASRLHAYHDPMEIPHHLVEQIRAGKAVLFLGAGASRGAKATTSPTDPPSGIELGTLLSAEFLGGDSADKSLSLIGEYCIAESDLRTVQHYIANLFNRYAPSKTQTTVADFRWAALVTTNYDQIIEKAYGANTKRLQSPVAILRNSDRVDHALRAPDSVPLLKLHGCVSMVDEVSHPLIITIDQYNAHANGREKLFNRFTEYAGEYSVVYVGYQIEDSDIRSILQRLDNPEMSRPMHYVVTPNPTAMDQRIWSAKKITTIDGTFDQFMAELDVKIPKALRVIKSAAQGHPIVSKFSTHEAPSSQLLAFLTNDVTYVYSGLLPETPNPESFFRGASYGWGSISATHDAKRSLTDTVLSEVVLVEDSERPRVTDFYLIRGYAGSGKTVILKRIAYDAAITFEKVVLFLRADSRLLVAPIAELCNLLGERLYIFIDDLTHRSYELEVFLRAARKDNLPITVLGTESGSEWNVEGQELSLLVDRTHELRSLNLTEIDALIAKLDEFRCLGNLATKTHEERRSEFLAYADRQLLVALYEITSGIDFQDIVFDEYKNISNDRARRIYLVVCALNRMNVPVRAGLLYRLTGISFDRFKNDFFAPLESIVLTEEYKPALDMAYRARHPWVAQIVFERALPKEGDRFDLYMSILKEIDIGYTPDRSAFRESIRAKNLKTVFSDPLMVAELFRAAETASQDDGYLFQQHAIYEMRRPNGSLGRASELISKARSLLPHDRSITHTFSELEIARADASKTDLERKIHREKARQYASGLTGSNAHSSHGHLTLVKLAIDRLRELLKEAVADDKDVTEAAKKVEEALSNGLQQFRNDEYLLAAEAEFSRLLNDEERAKKALTQAISKNPASSFIAGALSRVLASEGDYVGARKTLDEALRVQPGDKWLNGVLARLIEQHFPDDAKSAESFWRRSFTQGDTNYMSQFWFARRLYLNGNTDEAKAQFDRLKLARVPFDTRVAIAGRIRENGAVKIFEGVISHIESDYAWVTPYAQSQAIYMHCSIVDTALWQMYRQGDTLDFSIGFNYMGAAVAFVRVSP